MPVNLFFPEKESVQLKREMIDEISNDKGIHEYTKIAVNKIFGISVAKQTFNDIKLARNTPEHQLKKQRLRKIILIFFLAQIKTNALKNKSKNKIGLESKNSKTRTGQACRKIKILRENHRRIGKPDSR